MADVRVEPPGDAPDEAATVPAEGAEAAATTQATQATGARLGFWVALVVSTLLVLLAIAFDASPYLRGPDSFPREWRWKLLRGASAGLGWAWLPGLGLLGVIAALGTRLAREHARSFVAVALVVATLLGCALQVGLLGLADERGAANVLVQRTYSWTFTSFYSVAVGPAAEDVGALLEGHAEMLEPMRRIALHFSTHPLGPVLYYRAIYAGFRASPPLTDAAVRLTQGLDVDTGGFSLPADGPRLATALVAPFLLLLLGAATCLPLFALARACGLDELPASRLGVLWLLVPGPALMLPTWDVPLALFVASGTGLLAMALANDVSPLRRGALALATGLVWGLALHVSYGALAFVGLGAAAAALLHVRAPADLERAFLPVIGVAVVAFAVLLAPSLAGHQTFAAASTSLALHRDIMLERSWAIWIPYDLWDFALFVGVPVAAAGLLRLVAGLRATPQWPADPAARVGTVLGVGLLLLAASGLVRGETGRIWIPLMPLALVAALARRPSGPTTSVALGIGALLLPCLFVLRLTWRLP